MNHTQLLNYLIEKHNLKSYLEIGVQNPANNFNKINATLKVGVDPCITPVLNGPYILTSETSDEYFDKRIKNGNYFRFDLIFIDGLHHADQVQRDFENSLRCLNDGGFVVIHDCLPENEITTCVPRGRQKIWHGDVYKWAMTIKNYNDIDFVTLDMDNGCMVVWKNIGVSNKFDLPVFKVDWAQYIKHREDFMNIIKPSEIGTYL